MKVLHIYDNQEIRQTFADVLAMINMEVESVDNGREGLKKILEESFDVVLLDLAIPNFSGKQVIDSLHKSGKIKNQKVVIFTASSTPQNEIDDMIEKGAHSHIKKPIDPDVLIDYLSTLQ